MEEPNVEKQNIKHSFRVTREIRENLAGHKGAIVWFTGLSGSGKSTIADRLESRLLKKGCRTYILDGDNIRTGLNKDLGFSDHDRTENIRRIGEVARLFFDAAIITIVSFISPFEKDRNMVRNFFDKGRFIEVWAKCPIKICETRDPKGLYKKVRQGLVKHFTGISSPYESPQHPEIILETDKTSPDDCVLRVLCELYKQEILPR